EIFFILTHFGTPSIPHLLSRESRPQVSILIERLVLLLLIQRFLELVIPTYFYRSCAESI
ncbi:MAG: hypothetical protein SVM79_03200, partial [Chloroflexota bacterium]|nr:hypothetical protein [Chloroflexota bacterium]